MISFWLRRWSIICACFAPLMSPTSLAQTSPVRICDDQGEWPPFTYNQRPSEKEKGSTKVVEGFTVDLVSRIFNEAGIDYEIELLPWKRCLLSVKSGTHDMLLNATDNEERRNNYLFSQPHSFITPSYFYLKTGEELEINNKTDLQKYNVGGLLGYNYDYYGLDKEKVETLGVYNYDALIWRLKSKHIDLFVENYEILAGFKLVGKDYLGKQIGAKPIQGMNPTPVYMLFNRGINGQSLQALINQKIEQWESDGTMNKFREPYPFKLKTE